jgi:outer membrane protein assembly factor BamB
VGPTLLSGGWVLAVGKSGTAYVLRASHLGGIGGAVTKTSLCVAFGGTASVGNVAYVPCIDGLRAVWVSASGHIHVLWHAASVISGSPVVGGGRIWAMGPSNGDLYALDPKTGRVVRHIRVGPINRFATPALYSKYVIIPTLAGAAVVSTS